MKDARDIEVELDSSLHSDIHVGRRVARYDDDVFGHEDDHDIHYKTLSWQFVALLMITEIVSNGMLSLPQSLAVVGIVPGVVLIIFLGVFATYTSYVLVQFKLNHPQVHNMGDAGQLLFGAVGREVLSAGTVIFAVFATGSQLLSGQLALGALSDNKLCLMLYTGIFAIPILLMSFPRTLDQLTWLSLGGCLSIMLAGLVGMIGAGANPVMGRSLDVAVKNDFFSAFASVTNPVFSYAGHFMFFILISEMRKPQDAMKAAYVLQIFATTFYVVFAVVVYVYIGPTVASPALGSLPPKWEKAAYAIAIPNFLISGALYSHTAAKVIYVRLFRNSRHLHSHTVRGWTAWSALVILANGAAFVFTIAVPIFSYLIGLTASLFAAWYTYGIAGMFYLYDSYHIGPPGAPAPGFRAWRKHWMLATLNVASILAGAFICVAGTYVSIKLIVDSYKAGTVGKPFTC